MVLNFLKGFTVDGKSRNTNFKDKIKKGIKLHTIRNDSSNRWKAGNKIHFSNGSRTSNYNCFKEGVCVSTQKIEIIDRSIYVDDRLINETTIELLSENDGFDCIDDFWGWFDKYSPFEGKIIHWGGIRY